MSIEKIYWDSACFLAHLKGEAGRAEACDGVLERAERGEVLIVTSALTLAEVLWLKGSPKLAKEKAELVQRFFRRSFIRVVNVTRKLSENAQVYVWENGIKPKDAIHIATAMHLNVDAFETFDQGLLKHSGNLDNRSLTIREPAPARQGRMDLRAPAQTAD